MFIKNFRNDPKFSKKIVVENQEELEKIKLLKKPVIFISGHFNNFELMAMHLEKSNINLAAVGSDITSSTSDSSVAVPTTGQVAKSLKIWGGSTISDDGSNSIAGNRYVETVAPTSGQGANGDLWFVREA